MRDMGRAFNYTFVISRDFDVSRILYLYNKIENWLHVAGTQSLINLSLFGMLEFVDKERDLIVSLRF